MEAKYHRPVERGLMAGYQVSFQCFGADDRLAVPQKDWDEMPIGVGLVPPTDCDFPTSKRVVLYLDEFPEAARFSVRQAQGGGSDVPRMMTDGYLGIAHIRMTEDVFQRIRFRENLKFNEEGFELLDESMLADFVIDV